LDQARNLYGTTQYGGAGDFGTVFAVNATSHQETVLHSFTGLFGGDGYSPLAGLARDAAGNMYGTTLWGGAGSALGPFSDSTKPAL